MRDREVWDQRLGFGAYVEREFEFDLVAHRIQKSMHLRLTWRDLNFDLEDLVEKLFAFPSIQALILIMLCD